MAQATVAQHEGHDMSKMPGTSKPKPSPSPTPQVSPEQTHTDMPGMPMPGSSPPPAPQASPHQMDSNMPMPAVTDEPKSTVHTHSDPSLPSMSMNMGPLMVMAGNDIGIRVGLSDTNLISMGAMGSGTTWQPASGPMNMMHK